MKKSFLILLLIIAPIVSIAQGKYFVKTYYDVSDKDLLSKLAKAKSDTLRINLLNSLIMSIETNNDPGNIDTSYITRIISINAKAHLINDLPYQLLLQSVLASRKHDYIKSLNLYKQVVEAYDQQNICALNVLLQMRWLFNIIDKQDEKPAYYTQKLNYYLQNKQYLNAAACYHCMGGYYSHKSEDDMAINNYLKAAELFKSRIISWYTNEILVVGTNYNDWGNQDKALFYLKMGYKQLQSEPGNINIDFALFDLAEVEYKLGNYQKSKNYMDTLSVYDKKHDPPVPDDPYLYVMKGLAFVGLNQLPDALSVLQFAKKNEDTTKIGRTGNIGRYDVEYGFYKYYRAVKQPVLAEKNLIAAYHLSLNSGINDLRILYLKDLVKFYGSQNDLAAAYKYTVLYNRLNDSLQTSADKYKVASYEIAQKENAQNDEVIQLQQQHAVQEATIGQRNVIIWLSLAGLVAVCVLVVFVYRQLQVNKKTLLSLQQTQAQLIQSEKMASLGELTAGIAHEIQNPLNFVNNFSEVNIELVEEMELELNSGDKDEAISIAADIKANLEKIRHHGKRADGIVKGMLQHSRTGGTTKEMTDVNALADEYLRLAYHGLRAKDKSFNSELVTNFDPKLPQIAILPQEIGRVLLNLYTNAFYAVQHKEQSAGAIYKPTVEVKTSAQKRNIIIKVKDNGMGMPEHVKEKIMQPFFTTKPTGQGTGLGLSMSYDIVVKGHGGSIDVDTKENEYTEFTITLPQ
jgi:two-component system NtrC family sensor kinase